MKNRCFKVGLDQEENLKWLLGKIFYTTQCGRNGYIISSSVNNYAELFNKYAEIYHTVCPAAIFSDKVDLKENDVLFVHDLLGNFHCNIADVVREATGKCSNLFVTVLGVE